MASYSTAAQAFNIQDAQRYYHLLTGGHPPDVPLPDGRVLCVASDAPGGGDFRTVTAPTIREAVQRGREWAREGRDVWTCPALLSGDRKRENVAAVFELHADIDRPVPEDQRTNLINRGFMLVESGSPGHLHLYWRLRAPIDAGTALALNTRLREWLHGDDKRGPESLLRLPGTLNRKQGAAMVTIVAEGTASTPDALAAILDVEGVPAADAITSTARVPDADAAAFTVKLYQRADDEPCSRMQGAAADQAARLHAAPERHPNALRAQTALGRLAAEGHPGLNTAIALLCEVWGERTAGEDRAGEFDDMLKGMPADVLGERTADQGGNVAAASIVADRCVCEQDAAITARGQFTPAPAPALANLPTETAAAVVDAADGDAALAERVAWHLREKTARARADALFREQQRGHTSAPEPLVLTDLLAQDDALVAYRVGSLLVKGGKNLLVAKAKSGKTTLVGNLIRSLVDGDPFLGEYPIDDSDTAGGTVVLIDNELPQNMIRAWLRAQGIRNTHRVVIWSLRGRVADFDIIDPTRRAEWAKRLTEVGARFVILDCLRPVLDACGLSEHTDAGLFLNAFDELRTAAGIDQTGEALVVHHSGHEGEGRARGDSRIEDWCDAKWTLDAAGAGTPLASYSFAAFGRDVAVPARQTRINPGTTRVGFVSPAESAAARLAAEKESLRGVTGVLVGILDKAAAPMSKNQLETAARKQADITRADARAGIAALLTDPRIVVETRQPRGEWLTLNRDESDTAGGFASVRRPFASEQVECSPPHPVGAAHNGLRRTPQEAGVLANPLRTEPAGGQAPSMAPPTAADTPTTGTPPPGDASTTAYVGPTPPRPPTLPAPPPLLAATASDPGGAPLPIIPPKVLRTPDYRG